MPLPKMFAVLTCVALLAPWRAMADTSLLDPLQLLLQGGDPDEIFSAAIEAQIGITPEYADVVFWHSETGEEIAYSEIRDLMGPPRQDGALEMLILAEALLGADGLPIESARLARLIDAAYLASMRRPPEHVAVEFFDTRVGPVGDLTGGISGHSPLNQQPAQSAEERLSQLREPEGGRAGESETPRREPESDDWPNINLDSLPRAGSEQEALLAGERLVHSMKQAGLSLDVDGVNWARLSMVIRREADIDPAMEQEMAALEDHLVEISELPLAMLDPLAFHYNGQLYMTLVVFHADGTQVDAALAFRHRNESLGLLEFNRELYQHFESQ